MAVIYLSLMLLIESQSNCQRLVCLARLGEPTSTGREGDGEERRGMEWNGELHPALPLMGVRAYYTPENLTKTPKIRLPGVRVRPK